ncbi:NADPH-dependent FMN reductase [Paenibacillus eucommiae]|uniref:Azobenzene reductase n=1 Tax=Paenibacillus eucommiae TaxID=1355755 RepID=A0ABS4IND1_9BACL|nr:NADPH-dependent FMN reductase [Paenibacillus eucommiae]MBP1989015.1 azobenzene reductase [Paenibacillus eucommiae]
MNGIMKEQVSILVIGGSPRLYGRTQAISKHASTKLNELGASVHHLELSDLRLPLYDGTAEQNEVPAVVMWKEAANQADGFFITTPDYHNGMSGALKNALDHLGGVHFKRKPVAIAAMAGGGKGGINALNNLRLVMRGLYALVLPDQVVVDKHQTDDQFQLSDPVISERIDLLAEELFVISSMFSRKGGVA